MEKILLRWHGDGRIEGGITGNCARPTDNSPDVPKTFVLFGSDVITVGAPGEFLILDLIS